MIAHLQAQIKVVAEARRDMEKATAFVLELRHKWERENKAYLLALVAVRLACEGAEDTLRALTLQAHAETGNKHPAPGVDIKETSEMRYDPKEAFAWACKHLMALQLDKKSFEGIAKSKTPPPDLDFVETAIVYQATIATDLDKALKGVSE